MINTGVLDQFRHISDLQSRFNEEYPVGGEKLLRGNSDAGSSGLGSADRQCTRSGRKRHKGARIYMGFVHVFTSRQIFFCLVSFIISVLER